MLILIKGQKGRAVETIIDQIISNPMIFVFGEFLAQPNIIEVRYRQYYLVCSLAHKIST